MKKLSYLIFSLMVCLFFIPNTYALDTSLKVYDDANLLTEEEERLLKVEIDTFIEKYDMDMVLVTTNDNSSAGSTKHYAQDFYDNNGFGIGNTNDGILLLIDKTYGNNELWVVTTGEAILVYDDGRIDIILDNVVASKPNGYYSMFSSFISTASNYADKGVSPSNKDSYIDSNGDLRHKRVFPWLLITIITLIVPSVIVGILVAKNKMIKKATQATAYLDQNSVEYTRKEDRFITTHTSSTYIPRDTGSGGGGSSIHSSHSGVSHGGGGRSC